MSGTFLPAAKCDDFVQRCDSRCSATRARMRTSCDNLAVKALGVAGTAFSLPGKSITPRGSAPAPRSCPIQLYLGDCVRICEITFQQQMIRCVDQAGLTN
jgi:hypothetical protein